MHNHEAHHVDEHCRALDGAGACRRADRSTGGKRRMQRKEVEKRKGEGGGGGGLLQVQPRLQAQRPQHRLEIYHGIS